MNQVKRNEALWSFPQVTVKQLLGLMGCLVGRAIGAAVASLALVGLFIEPAEAGHIASCQADLPVEVGETMPWRATGSGGSGPCAFTWSGSEGLRGTTDVVTKQYTAVGPILAQVTVTDTRGDQGTATCGMHVVPSAFVEPPNVNPVLWVPHDVDPTPMVPQLERVWRSIRVGFFHLYGKTFKMNPLRVIVSPRTEQEICGGDCTDLGQNSVLMSQALAEADAAIGGRIPYTRAVLVMGWGGDGFAGAWSWDVVAGLVGDLALAAAAGVETPAIEPDHTLGIIMGVLGNYRSGLYSGVGTIAHELNHVLGWDDPHNFSLDPPVLNEYERQVVLAGPFLTETLTDATGPSVSFMSPTNGDTLSGTVTVSVNASDNVAMDAVVLLIDGQFLAVGTSDIPFLLQFDTTLVGHGKHTLTAIAYDMTGNTTETAVDALVENTVNELSCGGDFPLGTFHVCYYDGIRADGTGNGIYLGTLLDHPFPMATPNAGYGIKHTWDVGEIAFGKDGVISGIWQGRLDFPPGNYVLHFFTDNGLRAYINGNLVIDAWREQVAEYTTTVALDGPTTIELHWFENFDAAALHFWWKPTRAVVEPALVETAVSNPPATVAAGRRFTVTDTVENQGETATLQTTTRYYLSGDTTKGGDDVLLAGRRVVPTLSVGATSTGTKAVTLPTRMAAGQYYLLACVDHTDGISESSETNNCRASSARVRVTP
jgi:CARDB/Bacterial Ig domain/PA14 domain